MTLSNSVPDDSHDLRRLAVEINTCLIRLERLTLQLHSLKEELDAFLNTYFARISGELPMAMAHTTELPEHAEEDTALLEDIAAGRNATSHVMRQLYRQLARACHPDLHSTATTHAMAKVNEAYQKGELGSLMVLASTLPAEAASGITFSVDDMKHYQEALKTSTRQVEEGLEKLRQSDAYRLRTRLLMGRLTGNDVIADVVATLQRNHHDVVAA